MKIRMIDGLERADFAVVPGEVTDRFSDEEAQRHVDEGRAFLVGDDVELGLPASSTPTPAPAPSEDVVKPAATKRPTKA